MHFSTWSPVYDSICQEFGYDRADDERARDILAELATPFDLARLNTLDGVTVAVAGGAASLENDLAVVDRADAVLAASTAADVLLDAGVVPDAMVTDLDKNVSTARKLTERGVPVAAHAHGDNVPALRKWVPQFAGDHVLPTTQAAPWGPVRNFGGFTDGDRAAFLADHCGAAELTFPGWAFDDPTVSAKKQQKLAWAERLLYWLEHRRGERFAVLDGRRDRVDTAMLPL